MKRCEKQNGMNKYEESSMTYFDKNHMPNISYPLMCAPEKKYCLPKLPDSYNKARKLR